MATARPRSGRPITAVVAAAQFAFVATACAPARAPVHSVAEPASAAAGGEVARPASRDPAARPSGLFVGAPAPGGRSAEWRGTYAGGTRRGAIAVRLREATPSSNAADGATRGADGLAGDVVLWVTPRPDAVSARGARRAGYAVRVPLARARGEAGRLVLTTEPYYDPACDCTAVGTYRGAFRGDSLTGTYVTAGAATAAGTRGRWRAVRVAPAAARTP